MNPSENHEAIFIEEFEMFLSDILVGKVVSLLKHELYYGDINENLASSKQN